MHSNTPGPCRGLHYHASTQTSRAVVLQQSTFLAVGPLHPNSHRTPKQDRFRLINMETRKGYLPFHFYQQSTLDHRDRAVIDANQNI